jgi:hypothetical protein
VRTLLPGPSRASPTVLVAGNQFSVKTDTHSQKTQSFFERKPKEKHPAISQSDS